ncbi:hypothetical protein O6H91_Y345600 [Diphasiastrum complanatum]|nr:hypothetical protein O6H91_Y345600 [Diphasiastrum complanatum]
MRTSEILLLCGLVMLMGMALQYHVAHAQIICQTPYASVHDCVDAVAHITSLGPPQNVVNWNV